MKIRIEEEIYEIDYATFILWVKEGKISSQTFIHWDSETNFEWKPASEIATYNEIRAEEKKEEEPKREALVDENNSSTFFDYAPYTVSFEGLNVDPPLPPDTPLKTYERKLLLVICSIIPILPAILMRRLWLKRYPLKAKQAIDVGIRGFFYILTAMGLALIAAFLVVICLST